MTSTTSFNSLLLAALFTALPVVAQSSHVISVVDQQQLTIKRGAQTVHKLKLQMKEGYHTNSNTPSDEYLIPLRLTWDAAGPLQALEVTFPKPHLEKYEFAEKPLSVFSGAFEIQTKFKPAAKAIPGPAFMNGKLRYQACTDKMCLPPKTLDVKIPVLVE